MEGNKYKILFLNSGYFTGINGSKTQYLTKLHRYFYNNKNNQNKNLLKLNELISEENPDLVCLVEIKKGRQIDWLINEEYNFFDIETKYWEKSILRRLPWFKGNSNAFFSKEKLEFKKHYLKNWTKKLVYEIILPNETSLILNHFSLSKNIRKKQFDEINNMFSENNNKIICWDFNIFKWLKETHKLTNNWLKNIQINSTFPSIRPKKILDLFMCSEQINAKTRVLKNQISDHLPVVLELEV